MDEAQLSQNDARRHGCDLGNVSGIALWVRHTDDLYQHLNNARRRESSLGPYPWHTWVREDIMRFWLES